ncbi:hypothetical protein MLD52_15275 [Puniceicoccaceae bacterium K14]|nr:hypothetical protein [Puniceicoccaceae bacterium K14]
MRKRDLLISTGVAVAIAIAAILFLRKELPPEKEPIVSSTLAEEANSALEGELEISALEEPTPDDTTVATEQPSSLNQAQIESRRMYAAHAPLREPEIADPNSKTNQKIMQSMISKAIASKKNK